MKRVSAEAKGEIENNEAPTSPPTLSSPLPSPLLPISLSPPYPPSISVWEGSVGHGRYISVVTWFRPFQSKIANLLLSFFFPLNSQVKWDLG